MIKFKFLQQIYIPPEFTQFVNFHQRKMPRNPLDYVFSRGLVYIPLSYELLDSQRMFHNYYNFIISTPLKKNIPDRDNHLFRTRMFNYLFTLNTKTVAGFSSSIVVYGRLLTDLTRDKEEYLSIMQHLKQKYSVHRQRKLFGMVVGHLIKRKCIAEPKEKEMLLKRIEWTYGFAQKSRRDCDLSDFLLHQLNDLIQQNLHRSNRNLNFKNFRGIRAYTSIKLAVGKCIQRTKTKWNDLWIACGMIRNEWQIVEMLTKLVQFRGLSSQQKNIKLWCLYYLIMFLIEHHYVVQKLSEELLKIIDHTLSKLVVLPLNRGLNHNVIFLMTAELVLSQKPLSKIFTAQIKKKYQLALQALYIFITDNVPSIGEKLVNEFIQLDIVTKFVRNEINNSIMQELMFIADEQKEPIQFVKTIKSYGLNSSQFNQQRRQSYSQIYSQKSFQTGEFLNQRQTQILSYEQRGQILKFVEQKSLKTEYLELYMTLRHIFDKFKLKIEQINRQVEPSQRPQRLKSLQTWYVTAYLKLMKSLLTQTNGNLPQDFIQQLTFEILSRASELVIIDVNFEEMFDAVFNEQVREVLIFDIKAERFQLHKLFEKYRYANQNPRSVYEIQQLQMYYHSVVHKKVNVLDNDRILLPSQRMIERILQRNQPQLKLKQNTQLLNPSYHTINHTPGYEFDQRLIYPITAPIQNFFIKIQILHCLKVLFPKQTLDIEQAVYMKILNCFILIIEDETLLMEIFANIIYVIFQQQQSVHAQKLKVQITRRLNLIRRLFLGKYKETFKVGRIVREKFICLFDGLLMIQITTKSKLEVTSQVITQGRQEPVHRRPNSNKPLQTPVYQQFFQYLYKYSTMEELLVYARVLVSIRKFKESIFILQYVCRHLKKQTQRLNANREMRIQRTLEDEKTNDQMSQAYEMLRMCYERVQPQMRKLNQVHLKVGQKEKDLEDDIICVISKKIAEKITYVKHKLGLPTPVLQFEHTGTLDIVQQIRQIKQLDMDFLSSSKLAILQDNFKFEIYCLLMRYCVNSFKKITNVQDLKQFYQAVTSAMVCFHCYEQQIMELLSLVTRKSEWESEGNEMKMSQKESDQRKSKNKRKQVLSNKENSLTNGKSSQQGVVIAVPNYDQILTKQIMPILSPWNRLHISKLLVTFNKYTRDLKTYRLYYNSLYQSGKLQTFLHINNQLNGSQNFQDFGLIQNQLLQRYHFDQQNYQLVKTITSAMEAQLQIKSINDYGHEYVNWPEVKRRDVLAKIYDLVKVDEFLKFYAEIRSMLDKDTDLIVDAERVSLDKLKKDTVQELKGLGVEDQKVSLELQVKIQNYLTLFRTIYDNLIFDNAPGLAVMCILNRFYDKFFVDRFVADKVRQDFFFYYLRFLTKKIDLTLLTNPQNLKKLNIQLSYTTNYSIDLSLDKIKKLLLTNKQYIKCHNIFIIKALDPNINTVKNQLLIDFLVETICENRAEHLWTIAFLKNYNTRIPVIGRVGQNYVETEVNTRQDAVIDHLYKLIEEKLGKEQGQRLGKFPQLFLDYTREIIVETNNANQLDRMPSHSLQIKHTEKKKQLKSALDSVRKRNLYVPYPFDNKYYIKSVQSLRLVGGGKSKPIIVQMRCGLIKDAEEQNKRQKSRSSLDTYFTNNQKDQTYTFIKQILIKNNFSCHDCNIEVNSANFYKQINFLDSQTTYSIRQLTKYVLIIQKIQTKFQQLRQLLGSAQYQATRNSLLRDLERNYRQDFSESFQINKIIATTKSGAEREKHKHLTEFKKVDYIKQLMLDGTLPYFQYMFEYYYTNALRKWYTIDSWWVRVHNYAKTLAVWSFLCYLTKLGDRHLCNMMVSHDGKIINIDFEMNFGIGLLLKVPETVPFRMTELIMSPLGALREKGMFNAFFVTTAIKFDTSDANIWKAMGYFQANQQRIIQHTSNFGSKNPTSVQEKCNKIISTATDQRLLRTMFFGWQPEK